MNCILIQLLLPSLVTALIVACCVDGEEEHNIDRDTTQAEDGRYATCKLEDVLRSDQTVQPSVTLSTNAVGPVSMEMVLDVQEQETPHAEMAERIYELISALAQKDAEIAEKLAQKDAEKDAEMAEKDAEKDAEMAEKLAQKDAIIAERDAIIAAQNHSS